MTPSGENLDLSDNKTRQNREHKCSFICKHIGIIFIILCTPSNTAAKQNKYKKYKNNNTDTTQYYTLTKMFSLIKTQTMSPTQFAIIRKFSLYYQSNLKFLLRFNKRRCVANMLAEMMDVLILHGLSFSLT